jgi:hypothetical protein
MSRPERTIRTAVPAPTSAKPNLNGFKNEQEFFILLG